MNNICKHTVTYRRYIPIKYDYLLPINNLEAKYYTYEELSIEDKENVDCEVLNKSWMRCSEHCGNIVREVQ